MKKILAVLMVAMMFSLVACGTKEDNAKGASATETIEVLDTDWTKGEIQFDGKVLKFPFKFSELETMGWTITEVPDSVDSWEWSTLSLENSKYDSEKVLVFATLDATEEGIISDYMVSGLEITMWSVEENDKKPLVSIKGVSYDDSKEKVEEAFGKTEQGNQVAERYINTYTYYNAEPVPVLATSFIGMTDEGQVKAFGMHYNVME